MLFVTWISALIARFAGDRRAAIAPIFGVMVIPLLGAMGFAVDLSMMLAEKTRAQNIADAGVINAMRTVQTYMATNGNTVAIFNQIQSTAQSQSQAFMTGLASQDKNMVGAAPTVSVTYNSSTTTISAKAALSFNFQPAFMGIFGINNVQESVPSTASSSLAQFVQVVFLVDVSGSMGVGGDSAAIQALPNLMYSWSGGGAVGCVFACHQDASTGQIHDTNIPANADFRKLARNNNIKLKIDYAQSAVNDFTTKMISAAGNDPGHLSTSIYTFSAVLNNLLPNTVVSQSASGAISTAVGKIDLDLYEGDNQPDSGTPYYGGTFLSSVLQQIPGTLTNVGKGDGSSPNDQLTYLILVTDGVEDYLGPGGLCCGHVTDATWVSNCTPIKNMPVTIATVQAQYFYQNDPENQFGQLVAPIYNQIQPAMQTCASNTNLALSASDGPGLEAAVNSLFSQVIGSPRLTN
jgi:Flp pilus assembly protein TadG